MKRYLGAALLAACATTGFAAVTPPPSKPSAAGPDLSVVHLQVLLDRLGFSPGVIDGKRGFTLTLALRGLQKAKGLRASGALDAQTIGLLHRYRLAPTATVTLTSADISGPYYGVLPKTEEAQTQFPALGYANIMEMLAERYHTDREVLIALNSPTTRLAAGATIRVPNVVTVERGYPSAVPDTYRQTLAGMNVSSNQPQAVKLVVDKSDKSLSAYAADGKLVAQFPVTTGSAHDPLPIGRWKIKGASYNPEFHFNPKLFWDARKGEKKATLPPGPNGPVGIIWLDLSKPHYGIHGTPEPQYIGRTESHGCIRLTNWDAAKLSLMVKPGTPAIFQK